MKSGVHIGFHPERLKRKDIFRATPAENRFFSHEEGLGRKEAIFEAG